MSNSSQLITYLISTSNSSDKYFCNSFALLSCAQLGLSQSKQILEEKLENNEKSFAAKLADFMEELPNKMQEAAKIAENFDPEQFKNVINFATAANGGRPIDFSKENL